MVRKRASDSKKLSQNSRALAPSISWKPGAMDSRSPVGVGDKLRGNWGWPSGPCMDTSMDMKTAIFMAMTVWMLRQVLR